MIDTQAKDIDAENADANSIESQKRAGEAHEVAATAHTEKVLDHGAGVQKQEE